MNDCPNCEYHKKRAQLWRDEAYKQAGHPLPDREWKGLNWDELPEIYVGDIAFLHGAQWAEGKLRRKNS